jgi:hypothetical protein
MKNNGGKVISIDKIKLTEILSSQSEQSGKKKISIAHIINPVKVGPDNPSHLYVAQPVTFQTMINAQNYAKGVVDVKLFTAQYSEDREIIPDSGFVITSDLEKSIHDYAELKNKSKKLPTVNDIIKKLYNNSNAEYFIYSNADIAVRKNFYVVLSKLINSGFDAFCIHRMDVMKEIPDIGILDVSLLEVIYRLKGETHPGHDCFVFRRDIIPNMDCGNVFVGYPPIGAVLKNEIKVNCRRMGELSSDVNLTFHLGKDQSWLPKSKNNKEYKILNKMLAKELKEKRGIDEDIEIESVEERK